MAPKPRPLPRSLTTGPFDVTTAREEGVERWRLDTRQFDRVHRNVLLPAHLSTDFVQRCRAALHALPEGSVLSHHTAARLYDLAAPHSDVIHATVPGGAQPRIAGIRTYRRSGEVQTVELEGLPVTSMPRTWVDLAAHLDRDPLAIVGDRVLRKRVWTKEDMAAAVEAAEGRRGVQLARLVLPLLEYRVDSPMETRLRLIVIDFGLPKPIVNMPVYDEAGEFIATPDIQFEESPVLLQYEGDQHRTDRKQWADDILRDQICRDNGYVPMRFVSRDVYRRRASTAMRIRVAVEEHWGRPAGRKRRVLPERPP